MHPGNDAVRLEHEVAPRRRRERRRVIGESKRAGMLGERREVTRDQAILAGLRCAVVAHRHRLPEWSVK